VLWFTTVAAVGIVVLTGVGRWYSTHHGPSGKKHLPATFNPDLSRRRVIISIGLLLVLIFSKYFYIAGMTSYLTFYMMDKFAVSVKSSQLHLFIFQFAVAAGTLIGGPIGD